MPKPKAGGSGRAAVCSERRRKKVLLVQSCTVCEDLGQSGDGKTSHRSTTNAPSVEGASSLSFTRISAAHRSGHVACLSPFEVGIMIQSPDTRRLRSRIPVVKATSHSTVISISDVGRIEVCLSVVMHNSLYNLIDSSHVDWKGATQLQQC